MPISESHRLVDRFLIDGYKPQQLSTYALSLFRHRMTLGGEKVLVGTKTTFLEQNIAGCSISSRSWVGFI